MYIRRKVFSSVVDEKTGEEKLFSTTEFVNEEEYQKEFASVRMAKKIGGEFAKVLVNGGAAGRASAMSARHGIGGAKLIKNPQAFDKVAGSTFNKVVSKAAKKAGLTVPKDYYSPAVRNEMKNAALAQANKVQAIQTQVGNNTAKMKEALTPKTVTRSLPTKRMEGKKIIG
jgi:hypothetical protein